MRRKSVVVGAGVAAVLVGTVALWPGGTPRAALETLTTYRECFMQEDAGGTVGFGDSITAGHRKDYLPVGVNDSYFDVLACAGDSPIKYSGTKGVWGQTTTQMLNRLERDVVAAEPAQVMVLAGTNDVLNGEASTTIANLGKMHDAFKDAGIAAVFGLLPPNDEKPTEVMAMNVSIKAWAAHEGVRLVDYWTPLADPDGTFRDGMSGDGTHPKEAGVQAMADVARATLR